MGFLKKKETEDDYMFETSDILIIFDHDKKTSDIMTITSVTDDSVIVAGYYKVPLADCEITVGKDGRNYFYRAPSVLLPKRKD